MEPESTVCIETGDVQTPGGEGNDQHCVNKRDYVGIPVDSSS